MAQKNLTVIASAVAPVVSISGFDSIDLARETLFDLGGITYKAEKAMEEGKSLLASCDAKLYDIVTMPGSSPGERISIDYTEFMLIREFHIAGAVDKLDSVTAAEKRWERQITRITNNLDFVRPKSGGKDALRKAAKKEEDAAKLAEFSDAELKSSKAKLLTQGDDKSCTEVKKINAELTRRNAADIAQATAERVAIRDKLIARVKELAKAGTDDADKLLISALQMLS